ncbi:hypothetical protein CC78DRAFT_289876 [Lojkania enalia]|uniref:Uncharacterized protein n=1 Tax=Lojkania enalia TaxID=147567 RepID=A0A9P4K6Q5_9PLEO|nr:hypothetical protein CC78DRAFT_289876 [Didymosphaeria enalia]
MRTSTTIKFIVPDRLCSYLISSEVLESALHKMTKNNNEKAQGSSKKKTDTSNNKAKDAGRYTWFCCSRGDGPNSMFSMPACSECSHLRCSACPILRTEERK